MRLIEPFVSSTDLAGPHSGVDPTGYISDDFVQLEPGSALVLFTDGLVEGRHQSLDTGLSRFAAVLAELWGSADHLCKRLANEMLGDGPQEDDIAILVLLRLASS